MTHLTKSKFFNKYWVENSNGQRITPKFKLLGKKQIDNFICLETSLGTIVFTPYQEEIIFKEGDEKYFKGIEKIGANIYMVSIEICDISKGIVCDKLGAKSEISYIYAPLEGLRLFKQGLNYGFMDLKGNVVIEPQYAHTLNFNKYGYAIVWSIDSEQVAVIDKKGKMVIKWGEYNSFSFLSEEYIKVSKDGYHGVIDIRGKTIVPLEYADVWKRNLYFEVMFNNKYGLFNIYGHPVFECIYDEIIELPGKFVVKDFPTKEVTKYKHIKK